MQTPRIVKVLKRRIRGWYWLQKRGPLPKGAAVIRGGLMMPETLIKSAEDHFKEFEEYALSSFCCDGATPEQIAVTAGERLNYPKIRTSTVGAIRNLGDGYDVVPWGTNCYTQIRLPGFPTRVSMIQLQAVFTGPRRNPTK